MQINRRAALAMMGASAGQVAASQAGAASKDAVASFAHGIASGDPADTSVLLWTRVSPGGTATGSIMVSWWMKPAAGGESVKGQFLTGPDRDYTVKVIAEGLKPGTDYVYGFSIGSGKTKILSPEGKTRTLNPNSEAITFAVVSCSLYPNGYFNAYRDIAGQANLDAIIHLGDYIYEYGADPKDYGMETGLKLGRIPQPPHEIVSLSDYRQRHAQYKTDPDLQAAYARAPWIVVFDDHEITNDPWVGGAQNHNPEKGEGDWAVRKANALKAYFEWMPIREPGPGALPDYLIRSFRFGKVASLHMLETRLLARDKQLDLVHDLPMVKSDKGEMVPDVAAFEAKRWAQDRRLMGPAQIGQVEADLAKSVKDGVAWQFLGNQTVMATINGPNFYSFLTEEQVEQALNMVPKRHRAAYAIQAKLFRDHRMPNNYDQWDGYPAERERLYAAAKRAGARLVTLSGDSHTFWANNLIDQKNELRGVEFGATAVTSPPPYQDVIPGAAVVMGLKATSPQVVDANMETRGYILVKADLNRVEGQWIGMDTITSRTFKASVLARFESRKDGQGLTALKVI